MTTLKEFAESNRLALFALPGTPTPEEKRHYGGQPHEAYDLILYRLPDAADNYPADDEGEARAALEAGEGMEIRWTSGYHTSAPDLVELLGAVASDVATFENAEGDRENFAQDLGLNVEDLTGEYEAAETLRDNLAALLGIDGLNVLLWRLDAQHPAQREQDLQDRADELGVLVFRQDQGDDKAYWYRLTPEALAVLPEHARGDNAPVGPFRTYGDALRAGVGA